MTNQPLNQSTAPSPGRSQQYGDNDSNDIRPQTSPAPRTAPGTSPQSQPQPKPMPNPI